jgi:hypothetical protein
MPLITGDALYHFRLPALAAGEELRSDRLACQVFGIHHSTY